MGKPTRAYLDTNVLMEFRDIREHTWDNFLGVENVVLVVAQVVLEELQALKDKPGLPQKKRQRAGELIKRLERELFPEGQAVPPSVRLRDHVELAYDRRPPPPEIFSDHSLDPAQLDGRLVAAVVAARANGEDVVLISGDGGSRFLARGVGLRVCEPLEEWRRPIEPDEVELQNRELKRQLAAYQSAAPNLELQFEAGGNVLKYTLPKPRLADEEFVRSYVEGLRGTYELADTLSFKMLRASMIGVGPGEMDRYKRDLERFLVAAALVIPKAVHHRNWLDLHIPISLAIENSGSKPAESVRVDLQFPALHMPKTEFPLAERPVLPEGPRPPRSAMETIMGQHDFLKGVGMPSVSSLAFSLPAIDFDRFEWDIEGTSASIEFKSLRHQTGAVNLPALYVLLPDYEQAKGFAIEYQVHAHNLPKPSSGTINVSVTRGAAPSRLQLERDPEPEPTEDE